LQANPRANFFSCPDRRRESYAIQSIVDCLAHVARQLDGFLHKMAHQGERQKSVSDCRAIGRFAPRAHGIDVYPLPVSRRFSELVDALLGYRQPIRGGDFSANVIFQCVQRFQYKWHGVYVARASACGF